MQRRKTIMPYLIILFIFFLGINFVYASTTAKLNFCEYAGTIRVMKIIGYLITIIKIVVPILIIAFAMMDLTKVLISGKTEDLSKITVMVIKRIIAGFIIFLIPTLMNYIFNNLIDNNDSNFQACTTCLFNTKECVIPVSDPKIEK